ncbi:uncharacterized protein LOC123469827 [Daphnia magna]|uniref:uncharacterized protein LOC123469827 n=1 Tax=Daphnia magna TaxID=35525 RepID=UPI001E1BD482|nr:uncharacterized protein LOC123469827 [Daphnia magna]
MDLNIYVDNLISGCDSTEEALDYYAVSNSILNRAGLNLQSWSSNEQAVNARAAEDGVADLSTSSKILGLTWDRPTDSLSLPAFQLSSFSHATTTKRDILRGISTVFDPMGFFSPLTISVKILNQELWREKFDWDDPLPQKFRERFSKIPADIDAYHPVVPRCYLGCRNDLHDLHLFVDASQHAYGAVAYFCNIDRAAFVLSKSRVAPLLIGKKPPTLPQLELMAALIGSTLANTIVKAFKPLGLSLTVTIWSDSQIVLYWLAQTNRNRCQFVANRVDTIQKLSKNLQATWHYCPTKSNPADLLTRSISLRQFQQSSSLWTHGPSWLSSPKDWPSWETAKLNTTVLHLTESHLSPLVSLPVISSTTINLFEVMNVSRYSWISLVRVTSQIFRFKSYVLPNRHPHQVSVFLTIFELKSAELMWIRAFQQRFLQDEYKYLRSRSGARPALVSQHDLFINDDDIICCKGRLQHANIRSSAKHPFLLPKLCDLTTMIVLYHHQRMLHCGIDATCSSLRQRYWIPSIKQRVRSILRSCVTCRRVSGKPYRAPDHAPLPAFRVSDAPPFTVVGVDFTGTYPIRGISLEDDPKAYICLFTCASTRAIHLELVEDLSAQSFLFAFKRFVSHHSLPSMIISDNATNFECSADFITQIFKSPEVASNLTNQQVEWRFIPKRAPWYGGFWERLIGVTKIALAKMLGRTKPTFDELRTLVAEAEFVLNDRPIEKLSDDSQTEEALTPSHLMYGRPFTSLPFDHTAAEEILNDLTFGEKPSILTKAAARLEKLLCAFRKHFTTNYLTALREYHQATRGNHKEIVKIGDVVLVHNESPRHKWKLAVIESLIKSNDGHVRAADIRTASGKTNHPISKLYPLEVSELTDASDIQQHTDPSPTQFQPVKTSRPVRQAAIKANQLIEQMTMDVEPDED